MRDFLKSIAEKWNNWVGDHEMELAIRKHLTQNGYYGTHREAAKCTLGSRYSAPVGYRCFGFEATARVRPESTDGPEPDPVYHELYGVVKDDIRHRMTTVRAFRSAAERRELYRRWSDGLIELRGAHGLA